MSDHLHIITGGPGSGKTSLIQALAVHGIPHMPEAGRAIIQAQVKIGGNALPWGDRVAYAELMLLWELRSHAEASLMRGPVLMDRGIPDVIGYLTLCGLPVPDHVDRAAHLHRYNRRVFLAPFWPEIFTQDAERKQDLAEAEATCETMRATAQRLGYEIVELPRASIADRARFVLDHLNR